MMQRYTTAYKKEIFKRRNFYSVLDFMLKYINKFRITSFSEHNVFNVIRLF